MSSAAGKAEEPTQARRSATFTIDVAFIATGRKMHFTGTTVLRIENGKIAEEIGLDDGVTALKQLQLIRAI